MSTLTYSGTRTLDVQEIESLVTDCDALHHGDNDVDVTGLSLRFSDRETCVATLTMRGDKALGNLDTLRDTLQQQATDMGFEQPDADEPTDPTDGVELL